MTEMLLLYRVVSACTGDNHSLKLVDYLLVHAEKPWYNYYIQYDASQAERKQKNFSFFFFFLLELLNQASILIHTEGRKKAKLKSSKVSGAACGKRVTFHLFSE